MSIAHKDWLEFVRDRRFVVIAVMAIFLALAALAASWARVSAYEADRAAAQAQEWRTWTSQGARNPHGAAHFAQWAMRPLDALAILDPGVTPYAGSAVWMEAHHWNPARARQVEDAESGFDLGAFSVAWMLQMLLPLIIFVLTAASVARERERGTLRLLLMSGLSPGAVVRGKMFAAARVTAVLAVPIILACVVAVAMVGVADPVRLLLWCSLYLVYAAISATIALAVSAFSRTGSQAMLVLIGLWLVFTLLVPRVGASIAQSAAPVPSPALYAAAVADDREKQPDVFGDDAERFTAQVMRERGVARPEDLTVSIGGLQLEEDERLGNIVFEHHFNALDAVYHRQRAILRWFGTLSPLLAVQNLSMVLAGTSMPDQIAFQRQAESHRRRMVTYLNTDLIENGGGEEFDYLAGDSLWRSTPRFSYRPPSVANSLGQAAGDIVILLSWTVAAIALLLFATRRFTREAL